MLKCSINCSQVMNYLNYLWVVPACDTLHTLISSIVDIKILIRAALINHLVRFKAAYQTPHYKVALTKGLLMISLDPAGCSSSLHLH